MAQQARIERAHVGECTGPRVADSVPGRC
jgi:hypothetical protein